jgi:hypothetical protein
VSAHPDWRALFVAWCPTCSESWAISEIDAFDAYASHGPQYPAEAVRDHFTHNGDHTAPFDALYLASEADR